MSIFSSPSIFAGQLYALNCTVTIVTGVLNITWLDGNGNELVEGNGISFNLVTVANTAQKYDLIFNSFNYSNIGVYTCHASLTVDSGRILFNGNASANTTVGIKG